MQESFQDCPWDQAGQAPWWRSLSLPRTQASARNTQQQLAQLGWHRIPYPSARWLLQVCW